MPAPDTKAAAGLIVLAAGREAAGRRLDQWLAEQLGAEVSRSRVQALIRRGAVSIGGLSVLEASRRLVPGEEIAVELPEPEALGPRGEAIPLDVIYEDSELIVIDKPPGMVVHPGAGNASGTLVNALLFHCGDSLSGIGGVRRPGIVHRLDKDTSGVMVVAKTDRSHHALARAFADHGRAGELERAYVALVWGAPESRTGVIDAALGRASDRVRRAVVPEGRGDARRAVTRFTVLERFGPAADPVASLVECRLETGRTHQIRVHLAHIGHPVVGDPDYGRGFRSKANRLPEPARTLAADFPRQALHARLLSFRHPASGEMMRFEASIPSDMARLIESFRDL